MEASSRQAAPGELEVVRQFLNTRDVEEGTDEISTPEALRTWLAAHDLDTRGTRATRKDVRSAELMRESLRAMTLANNGERLDARAIKDLNALAEEMHLVVRFDGRGASELEPAGRGLDAALGALLAVVFRAMESGTWQRLKACREDTCQWAFYDRSKNRSGTWCSMAVCGNRAKARAYRSRRSGPQKPASKGV